MTTRVLIVDDEEMITFLLRQSLQRSYPDWEVDVVHSGEEALSSIKGQDHDLIITDVHMPGAVDGLDLIGEVRHSDTNVPVILITGRGSAALQARAMTLGVNHYISKPFDMNHLLGIAGELISGQGSAHK